MLGGKRYQVGDIHGYKETTTIGNAANAHPDQNTALCAGHTELNMGIKEQGAPIQGKTWVRRIRDASTTVDHTDVPVCVVVCGRKADVGAVLVLKQKTKS